MGDSNDGGPSTRHGWRNAALLSSSKLLLFIVPLLLGVIYVSLQGARSGRDAGHPFLPWKGIFTATATLSGNQNSSPYEATVQVSDSKSVMPVVVAFVDGSNSSNSSSPIHDQTRTENQPRTSAGQHTVAHVVNGEEAVALSGPPTERTKLHGLEGGLRRARLAIKASTHGKNGTQDPDYEPSGPMYWNAQAFHRSYIEMEKQFKIFIYEEGNPPVFHNGPCKSIYSIEGTFIHQLEINSQFRTKEPNAAHVFFLPFSVTMLVRFVYVPNSHDFGPIKETVSDYVSVIAGKYPFWNRSAGADHFMLSCHDWGPETSRSVGYLYANSIRVLCNANTSEGFNPVKDVSFPEINLRDGRTAGLLGGPSPSHRPILAFFAGGLHGPIRPVLLDLWENKDPNLRVHRYLPKGVSCYDMLRRSKFCLCPSGYEVASPRLVEALYTGCVPVLISDHYVPPFSDVLNWKAFAVEVGVGDIPNLKKILTAISGRRYIRMQRRGLQVRRHFEVNSPPKRFDVFHMILHSIWLRRMNFPVQNRR